MYIRFLTHSVTNLPHRAVLYVILSAPASRYIPGRLVHCRHGYECPVTYSPADFLVRTLAMTPGAEDASRQTVRRLCGEFAVSEAAIEVEETVQLQMQMASGDEVRQGWGLL